MDIEEFQKEAHKIVDWIVEYYKEIEKYPVKSQVVPGFIFNQLPDKPPAKSDSIEEIFNDFQKIIIPGISHWQSPNFFAYFPANSSYPSLLAEMLTAALGAQCMKWETSPAAAELEEKVLNWLRDMIGLPKYFSGVIQDTASTSTLAAIICARENFTRFKINNDGFDDYKFLRVYCSTETHSSIEKAVKIAGIGKKNLVKIEIDSEFRMKPESLEKTILKDISKGYKPLCVLATLGTTGSTSVDPIKEIGEICKNYNLWLHIDAAYAGSALILPEYRKLIEGIENADSFVFNAHKWLFTNFDCSLYFVKDKDALIRTFEINPEYLKTKSDKLVNNYCDWGIPLGRRFRALKLWFVIRSFGVEGLMKKLRYHISLANMFKEIIFKDKEFEIIAPVTFNLICFRFKPRGIGDEGNLNKLNEELLNRINKTGRIYISHTKLNGKYTLRFVIAQTNVTEKNVSDAWDLIKNISKNLKY
ncbi:MAG TPA: aminotransferase class V-fold PLP-dependent enzyme [Ignavibacteria bacterium]